MKYRKPTHHKETQQATSECTKPLQCSQAHPEDNRLFSIKIGYGPASSGQSCLPYSSPVASSTVVPSLSVSPPQGATPARGHRHPVPSSLSPADTRANPASP